MLKAYMVCSRFLGPREGAGLVFAHNVQEARKIGWDTFSLDFTDDYLDFAAYWLRDSWLLDYANPEKIALDKAHSVWDVPDCKQCEMWGISPIGDDGLCEQCRIRNAAEQPLALDSGAGRAENQS